MYTPNLTITTGSVTRSTAALRSVLTTRSGIQMDDAHLRDGGIRVNRDGIRVNRKQARFALAA